MKKYNSDGSWSKKVYVVGPDEPMPHLITIGLVGPGDNNRVDMTEEYGVVYKKDDGGWYYITGELICCAD